MRSAPVYWIRLACVFSLLGNCAGLNQAQVQEQATVAAPEAARLHSSPLTLSREAPGWRSRIASPVHRLSTLTEREQVPMRSRGGRPSIGVDRAVAADLLAHGVWQKPAQGRPFWRLSVESPAAQGIRVHFREFHAGAGTVWVYAEEESRRGSTAQAYTGDGLHGDGEFWSGTLLGSRAVIEFEPEGDTAPAALPFRVEDIAHVTSLPEHSAALSCNLDATCSLDQVEAASRAVAMILFMEEGHLYSCSGALIAQKTDQQAPLFVTANHCVGDAVTARTLNAFFGYRTTSCNGPVPSMSSAVQVVGAAYLVSRPLPEGDMSLLRLSNFPANFNAALLGWSTAEPEQGAALIGLHHPDGEYMRVSFGNRGRDVNARFDSELAPAEMFYHVIWSRGLTEGGSSGSALLDAQGRLVGTLTGGSSTCAGGSDYYGRFSRQFDSFRDYLVPPTGTVSQSGASLTSPVSGSTLPGATVTFTWTSVSATEYFLYIGTAPGANDVANRNAGAALAATISGLPTDGRTLYARLFSHLVSGWVYRDFTYRAATQAATQPAAALSTPTPGATLSGANMTFAWNDAGAAEYVLYIGNSQGATDFYGRSAGVSLSAAVTGLPVDGRTLYVRLHCRFSTGWVYRDYTYLAAGQPTGNRPALTSAGIVNAASFRGDSIAAGSLVTLFGSGLSTAISLPSTLPLPKQWNGVAVTFNGVLAPLVYLSANQINAQVPFELSGQTTAQVTVLLNGVPSNTVMIRLQEAGPGLIAVDSSGTGAGAILNASVGGRVSGSNPIARGQIATLFATGLGPVNPQPASGSAAPTSPLSINTNPVTVTVGGINARVLFSGLAPGYVGLYQINVEVPPGAPAGSAVPVAVVASGTGSNTVTMAVR